MERGELSVNDEFYNAFDTDLQNGKAWQDFQARGASRKKHKTLKELANPTQLGDPVSLKAEAADSEPTDQDRGAEATQAQSTDQSKKPSLKDLAKKNPSMLGDPVSLKAEAVDSEPTDQDKGAASSAPLKSEPKVNKHQSGSSASSQKKPLKELAKGNPSQIGDPVSLKAETSSTPEAASRSSPDSPKPPLKDLASKKRTLVGDPTSLHAETSDSSQPSHENTVPSSTSSNPPSESSKPPFLKEAAPKNRTLVGDPTSLQAETSNTPQPSHENAAPSSPSSTSSSSSSIPKIDTRLLFPQIMSHSQTLDPNIFPYLQTLRKSKRFILGALSNTIPTPLRPPPSSSSSSSQTPKIVVSSTPATLNQTRAELEKVFDFFISSSEIGMRKPEAKIYEYAMEKVREEAKTKGKGEVKGEDVVFLDDIGENLKAAGKYVGWRTIKVELGRTEEAVATLEEWTGLRRGEKSKL